MSVLSFAVNFALRRSDGWLGPRGRLGLTPSVHAHRFETDLACIRAKGTLVWLGMASGRVEPFSPYVGALKAVKFVFAS